MTTHQTTFQTELRISTTNAAVVAGACALLLLILVESSGGANVSNFRLIVAAYLMLCWLCQRSERRVNRVALLLLTGGLLATAQVYFAVPAVLLFPVLLVLAAGMLGIAVTIVTTAALSVWLMLSAPLVGMETLTRLTALGSVWLLAGALATIYRPAYRIMDWTWDFYQEARSLLEEARARKAELEQALQDLASANLQLKRLNILAQGLRREAENARQAKEQFVANVSHELRTPLNMIIGFSEMMIAAPETYGARLPAALLSDLNVIQRNARHLADLINDVLDLSQVESGRVALSPEHSDFGEIVDAAVTAVRPLYQAKNLYLTVELPPDLPPVFCDRTRMREVLLNLLSNAGRFTEQGGVAVRVWQEEERLRVAVADTGAGIARTAWDRVFEPFEQQDGSIRRRYGGTGLGLSISKHFIELHGGRIWFESEPGKGTTFFFELPIDVTDNASSSWTRWVVPGWDFMARTERSRAPQLTPRPRIIVLDGENVLSRLLNRYLTGVEVCEAPTLNAVLAALASEPAQAIVVNELSLNGAPQRLRHQLAALPPTVPVFLCTVPGMAQVADRLGVIDYLVKPIFKDDLLAAIARVNLTGDTILVVDDDQEVQRLFHRILRSSGKPYRVQRAGSGAEALAMMRHQRPDLVLLDLTMPEMDGFAVLEAQRADPTLREIPVIIVSAQDPAGQPVMSPALTIMPSAGLSAQQLLHLIEAGVGVFMPAGFGRDAPASPAAARA